MWLASWYGWFFLRYLGSYVGIYSKGDALRGYICGHFIGIESPYVFRISCGYVYFVGLDAYFDGFRYDDVSTLLYGYVRVGYYIA